MLSLLVLLCAAAPDWAAWLQEAAAIAPVDEVDVVADGTDAGCQRVRVLVAAATPPAGPVRPPVQRVAPVKQAAPEQHPRTRVVIGTSPATPRGPPRG